MQIDSLMTDLLGPLEMKISKEAKSYAVSLHAVLITML